MSIPGEKINLMIMRDNGEVRSVRMRHAVLIWLLASCLAMPLLAGGALWFAVQNWTERNALQKQVQRLEQDNQLARAKAERLANLEQLLQRNAATENTVVANVSRAEGSKTPQPAVADEEEKAAALQEGPGHNEFPAINSGYITVDNINVRLMPGNKLRMSLDLRNPDTRKSISGAVHCTLNTEAGESTPLMLKPNDAGDFKISRLKRAVLVAPLAPNINATNGQVIIEVRNDANEVMYRNVFPVER